METYPISVMIADDETAIRSGLCEAFPWHAWHAQVIGTAADGNEAISFLKRHHPDLAIIDIKMPGIDGLEVIRRAKEAGLHTRFLILSGYNDFSLAQRAISYGANGYFLKPLKFEELKDELTRQFSSILSERTSSVPEAGLDLLLTTSRLFFFNQLINNELRQRDEALRRYQLLNLHFAKLPFCVVVCDAALSDKGRLAVAIQQAESVFSGMLPSCCEIWAPSDSKLVLFIRSDLDYESTCTEPVTDTVPEFALQAAFSHRLHAFLADAIAKIKKSTGIRFFAGVGRLISSLEQIPASYSIAVHALSYHLYECRTDVYHEQILCRKEPSFSPDSIQLEPLLDSIEAANRDQILSYCQDFMQQLFFVEFPPPDFIRGMCLHLLNRTQIAFLTRHPEEAGYFSFNSEEIMMIHSIPDLKDWMVDKLWSVGSHYRASRENADPIISEALHYIQEHISMNIKARDLAARVNLSESYFTIYFKAKTGQNFRDYVLNKKIGHAKKLLRQQDKSISEIAYETGYQDYRSFSRAFKNVTGISPSDYQNQ